MCYTDWCLIMKYCSNTPFLNISHFPPSWKAKPYFPRFLCPTLIPVLVQTPNPPPIPTYLHDRVEVDGDVPAPSSQLQQPGQSTGLLGGIPAGQVLQQGLLGIHALHNQSRRRPSCDYLPLVLLCITASPLCWSDRLRRIYATFSRLRRSYSEIRTNNLEPCNIVRALLQFDNIIFTITWAINARISTLMKRKLLIFYPEGTSYFLRT